MAASTAVPIVRGQGEGERLWFYGGGIHTWKANSRETGGAFLLFEDVMTRGKVTPLHTHPEADETIYMLAGEILLHMEGQEYRVGPGAVAIAPRGAAHAFMVTSESARILCLQTPGSGEAFYRGASEPAGGQDGPVDFERIHTSAARHGGIEILGPPPFERHE